MPMRLARSLVALAVLTLGACDTAPDDVADEEQPNAAPVTDPAVDPANVPMPPGTDTLIGDTVRR